MKYKAFGDSLPDLTIEAETVNTALIKARQVNQGYNGVTPIGQTPQDKYNKKNTKIMALRLNYKTDKDIIEYLETLPNKAGYIKSLIRKDMKS